MNWLRVVSTSLQPLLTPSVQGEPREEVGDTWREEGPRFFFPSSPSSGGGGVVEVVEQLVQSSGVGGAVEALVQTAMHTLMDVMGQGATYYSYRYSRCIVHRDRETSEQYLLLRDGP